MAFILKVRSFILCRIAFILRVGNSILCRRKSILKVGNIILFRIDSILKVGSSVLLRMVIILRGRNIILRRRNRPTRRPKPPEVLSIRGFSFFFKMNRPYTESPWGAFHALPHPATASCAFPSPWRRGKKNAGQLLNKFEPHIPIKISLTIYRSTVPTPLPIISFLIVSPAGEMVSVWIVRRPDQWGPERERYPPAGRISG